jgi:hypothetical protein
MRLFISLAGAFLLAGIVLAGCQRSDDSGRRTANSTAHQESTAPGSLTPSDGIRRVTTVELRDGLEKGTAIVVDVRGDQSYKVNHIKGALSIPAGSITSRLSELPKDKLIVLYCS